MAYDSSPSLITEQVHLGATLAQELQQQVEIAGACARAPVIGLEERAKVVPRACKSVQTDNYRRGLEACHEDQARGMLSRSLMHLAALS